MAVGGTLFGAFSDRYGRRTALYTCTALAAILSALSASTAGFWPHFVWRTVSAMAVQGMATSDVVLVTEPVGASYRGRVGTVTQVSEGFGARATSPDFIAFSIEGQRGSDGQCHWTSLGSIP